MCVIVVEVFISYVCLHGEEEQKCCDKENGEFCGSCPVVESHEDEDVEDEEDEEITDVVIGVYKWLVFHYFSGIIFEGVEVIDEKEE